LGLCEKLHSPKNGFWVYAEKVVDFQSAPRTKQKKQKLIYFFIFFKTSWIRQLDLRTWLRLPIMMDVCIFFVFDFYFFFCFRDFFFRFGDFSFSQYFFYRS